MSLVSSLKNVPNGIAALLKDGSSVSLMDQEFGIPFNPSLSGVVFNCVNVSGAISVDSFYHRLGRLVIFHIDTVSGFQISTGGGGLITYVGINPQDLPGFSNSKILLSSCRAYAPASGDDWTAGICTPSGGDILLQFGAGNLDSNDNFNIYDATGAYVME